MKFSIETITPKMALKYLDSNMPTQRHLSSPHVAKLQKMMDLGEFNGENGDTIKFNGGAGNEVLVDGQHRLWAVVHSGKSLKTGVVRGLSGDAFKTIDNSQRTRTVSNYYEIANKKHASISSQIAKWLYGYMVDTRRPILSKAVSSKTAGFIAEWALENHPDIPDVVDGIYDHIRGFSKAGLGSPAQLAFVYYLWAQKDQELAYSVVKYLGSSTGIVPATFCHLKQALLEMRPSVGESMAGNQRFVRVVGGAMLAWNAHRRGSSYRSARGIKSAIKRCVLNTCSLPLCL